MPCCWHSSFLELVPFKKCCFHSKFDQMKIFHTRRDWLGRRWSVVSLPFLCRAIFMTQTSIWPQVTLHANHVRPIFMKSLCCQTLQFGSKDTSPSLVGCAQLTCEGRAAGFHSSAKWGFEKHKSVPFIGSQAMEKDPSNGVSTQVLFAWKSWTCHQSFDVNIKVNMGPKGERRVQSIPDINPPDFQILMRYHPSGFWNGPKPPVDTGVKLQGHCTWSHGVRACVTFHMLASVAEGEGLFIWMHFMFQRVVNFAASLLQKPRSLQLYDILTSHQNITNAQKQGLQGHCCCLAGHQECVKNLCNHQDKRTNGTHQLVYSKVWKMNIENKWSDKLKQWIATQFTILW